MLGASRVFFLATTIPAFGSGFATLPESPRRNLNLQAADDGDNGLSAPTVKKVGVTGATGRTGKFVVNKLLERDVQVVAMVRSAEKALNAFPEHFPNLEIMECDLTNRVDIEKSLNGCDSAIWCATGFSDAKTSIVEKLKRLLGIALSPKESIGRPSHRSLPETFSQYTHSSICLDAVGIPIIAECMLRKTKNASDPLPKVVMLSSAGVTRPGWDDAKKKRLSGCADIPIVRLNPAESEEKLRQSGVDYCIVRPCGLNDNWPSGSRPVFSQGDVAVGRINRQDVAAVLVDLLAATEACGKTFEVVSLASYGPPQTIGPLLAGLKADKEGIPEEAVEASYFLMQQLLPGERQDAAALAMGQTYEQLDAGTTGRFGERGKENIKEVSL
eukprot:scaffold2243_cov122-Cylindrotheca_fusiformis.AAC.9